MSLNLFKRIFLVAIGGLTLTNCSSDSDILFREVTTSETNQTTNENNETQNPPAEITSFLRVSDFNLPPQDEDGFSILQPSSGSQIIYVNNISGDDSTAEIYTASDSAVGEDPFDPTNTIKPFATLAAAYENMREGEPDMMLLAAGGVWHESLEVTNGRNTSERSIYSSYGSGSRPELRTGSQIGIETRQCSNVIISNIKFWAHTRDDEGPYFENFDGASGFNFFTRDNRFIQNVLIEDCFFRSYKGNVLTGTGNEGRHAMDKVVLRRNMISRNYSVDSHSQGLFYSGAGATGGTTILLEENIFYHNGWRLQRPSGTDGMPADNGQATFFNHNTYFENAKGVLFYGNIFLRPSSMGNKWTANNGEGSSTDLAMVNNLYIDGEIGIGIGGNNEGPRRFKNILISNNVMLHIGESQPTNRTLAWNLDVKDWDGGEIKENLFLAQRNEAVTNVYAMSFNAETAIKDVTVSNNISYGLEGSTNLNFGLLQITGEGTVDNINFTENYFHNAKETALVSYNGASGYSFSKNYYQSTVDSEWFGNATDGMTMADWTTEIENDAQTFESNIWSNPERDIESYLSANSKGSSMDDFIGLLNNQSKANWDASLTAPYINQWIREGFNR